MRPTAAVVFRRRARAQALAWFAFTLPAVVLALSLVADGTLVFATHRRALALADGAALEGAGQVDIAALRADPQGPARLDVAAAQTAATAYVTRQEPGATARAQASPAGILVSVGLAAPTMLLHPPGMDTVQVTAEAEAEPFRGVETPRH